MDLERNSSSERERETSGKKEIEILIEGCI